MYFGSDFVYLCDLSDEEYISEQELERGLQCRLSDDEEPKPKTMSCPRNFASLRHQPEKHDTEYFHRHSRPRAPTFNESNNINIERDHVPKLRELQVLRGNDGKAVKIIDSVAAKWEEVAIALDMETFLVELIRKDSPQDCRKAAREMFTEWLNPESYQSMPVTWGTLIDCLKDTELSGVAEDIESVIEAGSKTPVNPPRKQLLSVLDEAPHTAPQTGRMNMAKMMDKASKKKKHKSKKEGGGIRARKMDTNVVAVRFENLASPSSVHTGDVVYCCKKECGAVLSHLSKITKLSDTEKKWKCEFCGTDNKVDIDVNEIPKSHEVTYLLCPAYSSTSDSSIGSFSPGMDDSILVFCIDISGSMCVTSEVKGKISLRSDKKLESLRVEHKAPISSQLMPGQKTNVTYISRLQSVQAAIHKQLVGMAVTHPLNRVALITFNEEVTLVGDGGGEDKVVAGDKLSKVCTLMEIGKGLPIPSHIKYSIGVLEKKLSELEEDGQTALGPALLLSILLAGQRAGSQVIVCTDGLANVGVGRLDNEEGMRDATQFYKALESEAIHSCVTVSILTMKGEECQLMKLGDMAKATGGEVFRVEPSSVATEFSNIVSNPVLATNVVCKINLHSKLYCQSEGGKRNVEYVNVGNVNAKTEFSFEYRVRKSSEFGKSKGVHDASHQECSSPYLAVGGKSCLPFQLQTQYTTMDGSTLLRVNTTVKPVTIERGIAEKGMNVAVVGSHGLRTSAKFAQEGRFLEARAGAIISHNLLTRSDEHDTPDFKEIMKSLVPFERSLRESKAQDTETSTGVDANSDFQHSVSHGGSNISRFQQLLHSMKEVATVSPSFHVASEVCTPKTVSPRCCNVMSLKTPMYEALRNRSSGDAVAAAIHTLSPVGPADIIDGAPSKKSTCDGTPV